METRPVEDSIAKVNDEIAVGSDLEFQKRWWRFERIVWVFFTILIALDVLGAFGRGALAKTVLKTSDGVATVKYERIARYSTPSTMTVEFERGAITDGRVQMWVSDSHIRDLGMQRAVPQPTSSELDHGGVLYTFASSPLPDSVEFSLQPKRPGVYHMTIRISGSPATLDAKVLVMP